MRNRKNTVLVLLLPAFVAAGCASLRPGVLGREVTVRTLDAGRPATKGELVAIDAGDLVVRGRDTVERVPLAAVRDVRVERHGFGFKKGLIWSAVGGALTSGALWASCRTVPGVQCGRVAGVVFGLWIGVGGGFSFAMESTTHFHVARPREEELRIYSRFPQGLPESLALESLVPPALGRPRAEPPPQTPAGER